MRIFLSSPELWQKTINFVYLNVIIRLLAIGYSYNFYDMFQRIDFKIKFKDSGNVTC